MARISVEQFALKGDARFDRLAQLAGYADRDHARGKVEHLWNECQERGTNHLPLWLVETHLGRGNAAHLVTSELADTLGPDPRAAPANDIAEMRIRGTKGRTDWLEKKRKAAKKGGKLRAAAAGRVAGRFTKHMAGDVAGRAVSEVAGDAVSPLALALAPALVLTTESPAKPAVDPKPRKPAVPGFQPTLDLFHQRFLAAYGTAPSWSPKNRGILADLVRPHGAVEVQRRIGLLFDSPPSWLTGATDVGTLASVFDKLVAVPGGNRNPQTEIRRIPLAT